MINKKRVFVFLVVFVFWAATMASSPPQTKVKPGQAKIQQKTDLKVDRLLRPKIIMERKALESPAGMKIFETQALSLPKESIQKLVKQHNIVSAPVSLRIGAFSMENYQDTEKKFPRLLTNRERGHVILLPHLEKMAKLRIDLLDKNAAMIKAREHVNALQLIPKDDSAIAAKEVITLNKADLKQGQTAVRKSVLQSVVFRRSVGGKLVRGKGSQLVMDLGHGGELVGLNRTWNKLQASALKPEFRTAGEVYDDIEKSLLDNFRGAVTIQVHTPSLLYFGDDRRYVQPAYSFTAEITSSNAVGKAYYEGVVTALKNPPEAVLLPKVRDELPQNGGKGEASPLPENSAIAENDPTVGRYVVRDDSWDWVDDARDFKLGLMTFHLPGMTITFGDYLWNEPRFSTTQENSFVDKWNITLIEGHGNNWLFTTAGNCCDVVNLNSSQPPYGNRPGSSMRYLILKGCDIIPSPQDRTDWPNPWWGIFKGLRQAIGFRTSMWINDNISLPFAIFLGLGGRILDSWFAACNGNGYHDGNMGYGCIVMIPGHESDTIYMTSAAPPATETGLTVWWQY
jgi:hypothetical protein